MKITRINDDQFLITGVGIIRKTENLEKILKDLLNEEYREDIVQKTEELEGRLERVEVFCELLSARVPEFRREYE